MEKKEHVENQVLYITNSAYDELNSSTGLSSGPEMDELIIHKYDCQDEGH